MELPPCPQAMKYLGQKETSRAEGSQESVEDSPPVFRECHSVSSHSDVFSPGVDCGLVS